MMDFDERQAGNPEFGHILPGNIVAAAELPFVEYAS